MGMYERLTELSRMKTEGSLTDEQYATLVELAKGDEQKFRFIFEQMKDDGLFSNQEFATPSESANKQESKSSKLNERAQIKDNFSANKIGQIVSRLERAQMKENFTANKVAQIVSTLAFALLILGVIGSIIIALSPTETCRDFGSGFLSIEICEKDWTTSLTKGLVGLLLNSLVMLSITMVALYIQERTSTTEE